MTKADFLAKHLDMLTTPKGDIIKFVQFNHSSPGLNKLRKDIAEAILHTLDRYDAEHAGGS